MIYVIQNWFLGPHGLPPNSWGPPFQRRNVRSDSKKKSWFMVFSGFWTELSSQGKNEFWARFRWAVGPKDVENLFNARWVCMPAFATETIREERTSQHCSSSRSMMLRYLPERVLKAYCVSCAVARAGTYHVAEARRCHLAKR